MVLYRTFAALLTAWHGLNYASGFLLVLRCIQHDGTQWFAIDWRDGAVRLPRLDAGG